MEKHANSKTVTIFRASTHLSRIQDKSADDHFAQAKVSIGSYWEGRGSQKVGSGLTHKQEELLLPNIIDCTPEDREFRKKVTTYYSELDTYVPHNTGITLEIGLEKDNNAPVSATNFPIELSDYIRYQQAKGHPFMAQSKEEADGNSNKQFYIFDKDAIKAKGTNKIKEKDAAMSIYFKIKDDPEQVDQMLLLLGMDPREYVGTNADADKIEALRVFADSTNPKLFFDTYEEGNLKVRSWVRKMINVGVLKIVGLSYRDAETNSVIGNTLEETISYLMDEATNSSEISMLKSRTQEMEKKPIAKTSRRTKPLAGQTLR